jgi:hypothetical protein
MNSEQYSDMARENERRKIMDALKKSTFFAHPFFKNIRFSIDTMTSTFRDKVRESIVGMIPPIEEDIEEAKAEIWNDITALYYKFEVNIHKRGFREVMREISDKIQDDKWSLVYQKMYRIEKYRGRIP